jgi:hypothetical protein
VEGVIAPPVAAAAVAAAVMYSDIYGGYISTLISVLDCT